MKSLLSSPMTVFIAQALVLIAVARVIGLGAKRLHQPMVIAEMLAGIALGPSLLGWALPSVSAALFPPESLPLLSSFSQIGLMLFMFLVGLEFDPALLRGRARASVAISHTSIVVPFALGAVLASYLYPRLSQRTVPFSSFALFMGAAMSITAFPVLARILAERGLLRSRVGSIAIACAAVDDVTAWCILAFVVAIVRSTGLFGAVRTTVLAIGYVLLVLYLVRPFLRRLAERGLTKDGISQNLFAVALALLLLSSWITELIGVHALFGAFLMGVSIPKERGFARVLAEKLEDLVVVFLMPLFFAYSGLRTQIGLLDAPERWGRFFLILVVACVGKFGGSTVAARLTGLRWREASAIGVLMNTRGLMELVVLNLGLDLGVIPPPLFTMMVMMAIVTTVITTPLLERIYPTAKLLEELTAAADAVAPPEPGFTVLACVGANENQAMVTLGAALTAGADGAHGRFYAMQLIPPANRASFVLDQHDQGDSAAMLPLIERARALGVAIRPLSFVSAEPARDICNVAEMKRAGVLLIGWERPLLGSAGLSRMVGEVIERAACDVGVIADRGLDAIRRIAVLEGGEGSAAALRLARRIAAGTGAVIEIAQSQAELAHAAVDLVVTSSCERGVGAFGKRESELIESCSATLLFVQASPDRAKVAEHVVGAERSTA